MVWLQRKCLRGKDLGKIPAGGGQCRRVSNIQQTGFSNVSWFQKINIAQTKMPCRIHVRLRVCLGPGVVLPRPGSEWVRAPGSSRCVPPGHSLRIEMASEQCGGGA